jgi:DNA-binding NtrC family response regulator
MAKNIIIVDDEPHILKAFEMALSDQGYDIKTAVNADKAFKLINKKTNLVLLDIMMPGMRPIDLINYIKTLGMSNVKFIYVSAVPFTEKDREDSIKQGLVVDFISKPVDPDTLLERVKRALGE